MKSTSRYVAAVMALGFALGSTWDKAAAGDPGGNFMVRLQGTYLDTQDKTRSATSSTLGDIKALGYDAEVSNQVLPTATLTYFLTPNIAAELFCCFATGSIDLRNNGAKVGEVADTWMFPPIVTLQYHFHVGALKPYVGAGVQWIHFFDSGTGNNALQADRVRLSDAVGPVLQAGFDYHLGNGWYLNADIKKAWLDTKVTFDNAQTLGPHNVTVKQTLDPLIISAGIAYRFNLDDLFGRRPAYVPVK